MFDQIDSIVPLAIALAGAERYGVKEATIGGIPFVCGPFVGVRCREVSIPAPSLEAVPNPERVVSSRPSPQHGDLRLSRIGHRYARREHIEAIEDAFPGCVWQSSGRVIEPMFAFLNGDPVAVVMPYNVHAVSS